MLYSVCDRSPLLQSNKYTLSRDNDHFPTFSYLPQLARDLAVLLVPDGRSTLEHCGHYVSKFRAFLIGQFFPCYTFTIKKKTCLGIDLFPKSEMWKKYRLRGQSLI